MTDSLNGIKIKLISASRIFGGAMTSAGSTSPYWQGYEDLQKALTELDDFIRQHATAPDIDTLAPIILQGRENHESCTITAKKIIRAMGGGVDTVAPPASVKEYCEGTSTASAAVKMTVYGDMGDAVVSADTSYNGEMTPSSPTTMGSYLDKTLWNQWPKKNIGDASTRKDEAVCVGSPTVGGSSNEISVNYSFAEMPNGEFVGEVYNLTHEVMGLLDASATNEQFIATETALRNYVWKACQRAIVATPGPVSGERILKIIKETLDSPTFIDPIANCKNLTKSLQEIERLCKAAGVKYE